MVQLVVRRLVHLAMLLIMVLFVQMFGSVSIGVFDTVGLGYGRSAAVMRGDLSTETAVTTIGAAQTWIENAVTIGGSLLTIIALICFVRTVVVKDVPRIQMYLKAKAEGKDEEK